MDSNFEPPTGIFSISSNIDQSTLQSGDGIANITGSRPRRIMFQDSPSESKDSQDDAKSAESVIEPSKKKSNSKFSFSTFTKGSSKKKVTTSVESTSQDSSAAERVTNQDDELVFSPFVFIKSSYIYGEGKAVISESYKKLEDWNQVTSVKNKELEAIEKQKAEKELSEKIATDDVLDMFGVSEAPDVVVEPVALEDEKVLSSISDSLNKIKDVEVVSEREKNTPPSSITVDIFFDKLTNLFRHLNAEERGRIILQCIFGGLISRAKLIGNGGKSAVSKFKDLIDMINKLSSGSSSGPTGNLFTQLSGIIKSPKLNKYRIETSAAKQVTNLVGFIRKLSLEKTVVFFPNILTIVEPFPLAGTPPLNVSLSGAPTIDNLNNFFVQVKEPVVVAKKTPLAGGRRFGNDYDLEGDEEKAHADQDRFSKDVHTSDRWGDKPVSSKNPKSK